MPIIKVGDKEVSHDKNTVLESLEAANLKPHYHCRDGFCGVCRCKLVSGQVEYINDPLAYIRKGEFLACVSYPTTDIEIEVPD